MGKLNSRRVKRTPQTGITSDRYEFLGLEQAEPNLGDPLVGPSSIGANPIPIGEVFQIAAIGEEEGKRYWTTPIGVGETIGVISVYDEGVLPNNSFNKIHGLNFVGLGVTIETPSIEGPFPDVGIATIRFNLGPQGIQGTQGVFGATGTQGIQGVQGITGSQGVQGNTGTQGFQGVQGRQGIQGVDGAFAGQGIQGTTGSQGIQGIQGSIGLQGIQGINGPQGVQGNTGIQGIQGTTGAQGIQGITGTQGVQGISGTGNQGLQGIQGTTGTQGLQGIQGLSGSGSQGIQGITGTQGLQGVQGISGEGNQGLQGIQGTTSSQGIQGIQGVAASGSQGIQGIQGITGSQGVQGVAASGSQGIQGITGSQGIQGITGTSPDVTDDISTALTRYPIFVDVTTGTPTSNYVSSTNLQFVPSTGTFSATIFTSLSDRSQKQNITPIESPIKIIEKINGIKFDWVDQNSSSYGVIAQELEEVLPELVTVNNRGLKTVNYDGLIAIIIEGLKEQQKQIDKLRG